MDAGGFPIDLILFGMVAAFLVLRLRSILGRRTGYEPPPQAAPRPGARPAGRPAPPVIEGQAEPVPPRPGRKLPDAASPAGQGLAQICGIDRNFDPARFLAGAEQAFRLIVERFAAGDRAGLRPLLTDDTFAAFDQVIAAREEAGETQRTEIRAMLEVAITEATVLPAAGSQLRADIVVRFTSEQISLTTDRAGKPVHGVDAITHIIDLWTFERDLKLPDPAWRLAATRSD